VYRFGPVGYPRLRPQRPVPLRQRLLVRRIRVRAPGLLPVPQRGVRRPRLRCIDAYRELLVGGRVAPPAHQAAGTVTGPAVVHPERFVAARDEVVQGPPGAGGEVFRRELPAVPDPSRTRFG
jgi:hypothetical protein